MTKVKHRIKDLHRQQEAYRMRAVESYQAMVDALKKVRPLAIRAGDVDAILAIDDALTAAGHPPSDRLTS